MLRQGEGSPVVLFHGILGSERMWHRVVPLLAATHATYAPTALGHRGGPAAQTRPARIAHVVDDAERVLDELGLAKAHLVGNSMGGWVALELARRGRALSVCAFSPAGFWKVTDDPNPKVANRLRGVIRDTKLGMVVLPLLARSGRFRKWAMRLNAVHGDRLGASELVEAARDLLGCAVSGDLLRTPESFAPFEDPSCPVTIAWSEKDRVFPIGEYGSRAKTLVPRARYLVLDDVGHVPMFDSPERVARLVIETAAQVR